MEARTKKAISTGGRKRHGALAGVRVLVVEDEFLIAMQIQSIFEDEGAEVIGPFHTLADALQHAARENITAATLDLNLGRDSATAVAVVLERRHVPFVFYSVQTRSDPAIADWAHIRLISKPAAPAVLVEAIAELVRAAAG
jgi:DNA-binding response OmpR family regulator